MDEKPPFTQEQIEWLAERDSELATNHAKGEATRRRRFRNGILVGFLVLLLGIGGSFYAQGTDSSEASTAIVQSGRAISVDGCNRDFHTIGKVRGVFMRSALFLRGQYDRGDISLDAYERGVAYYAQQLATFPLPDCRAALTVVTDDPDAPIRVPTPLYPTHDAPRRANP